MIQLVGVGKRYGRGRPVLSGVDLSVPPAQLLAVSGANGSGKSTLLRVLAGCTRPTSGQVLGRPLAVGYVPERFPARVRLSAQEYLRHLGAIRGLSRPVAGQRADELLERFGFVGSVTEPIFTLSKGNTQKVALAQALIAPAGLLVLDEPWTGLDDTASRMLGEVLHERAADGAAVVFIDHDKHREHVRPDRMLRVSAGGVQFVSESPEVVELTLQVRADRVDELLAAAGELGCTVARQGPA